MHVLYVTYKEKKSFSPRQTGELMLLKSEQHPMQQQDYQER